MFFTLLFGALLIFVIFSILFVAKIFKEKPVFKLLLISFIVIGLVAFLAAMLFSGKVHKLVAFWLCEIGFDWLVFLPFVFLTTLVIFLFSYFKVFSRSFGIKIFYVMSVIAFLLLAYGRYTFYNINYKMYNLSFLDTVAKSENAKCGSMKIVAVSDLHLGNYINRDNLKRFVDSINASNPQIVLFVGDIIDNELFPLIRQQMEKEFIKLKAPLGKYIVFGNHESYGSSSKEDVADYYRQCGLTVLRDSAVLVDSLFYLVGRDDKGHGKSVRKSTDYIIKKSIKDYNNNIPIIVLDHCPATFKEWNNREHIEYKPFLVLSGHTHNGQIFPFNKIVKNMYPHYYGQFFEDDVNYITTSGLGQWGPKFRLGTNSEIVVINLLYNRPNAHINEQVPMKKATYAGDVLHS
ncbi:MAG: metallophosphoesterase, partial [Bacteroidales bacterium]